MRPIHICFVSREYAHQKMGKTGGIGVFLKQFTKHLKSHNFEITVFSYGSRPVRFNDEGINIIKIRDLSGFNERLKSPLRRYRIPGYISFKILLECINRSYISVYLSLFVIKRRCDIIELHDYGGDAPFLLSGLPKIIRCHGSALTLHQFMGYTKRITDTIFEKMTFKRFNKHIIAVSEYSAVITQKTFKLNTKPKVIYNGVDTHGISKNPKQYLDAPTLPQSIFYFGSVRERKGINVACEVFNTIIGQFPEASLHVLGNNNNDYWNQVAVNILTKEALNKTTYYGMIPNEEIFNYLDKAHVVIFPSYGENFSIALLEVMALGKIAVTSTIPAFEEVIQYGYNGFMSVSSQDFIEVISKIFRNVVDLENISKYAKETVNSKFSLEQLINENTKYYNSLLKNKQ